jgi:hypothetical protein
MLTMGYLAVSSQGMLSGMKAREVPSQIIPAGAANLSIMARFRGKRCPPPFSTVTQSVISLVSDTTT